VSNDSYKAPALKLGHCEPNNQTSASLNLQTLKRGICGAIGALFGALLLEARRNTCFRLAYVYLDHDQFPGLSIRSDAVVPAPPRRPVCSLPSPHLRGCGSRCALFRAPDPKGGLEPYTYRVRNVNHSLSPELIALSGTPFTYWGDAASFGRCANRLTSDIRRVGNQFPRRPVKGGQGL
jgi:hypothetical protein